ncbi:FabD/lysophospholipase-like protein [Apiospora hydei]|uniref:FabD/lysophospholipase-like protein n=1 Tax=Apiospora hydei TaxID=1337664 RepID=A0ABR1WZK6_9PEZI
MRDSSFRPPMEPMSEENAEASEAGTAADPWDENITLGFDGGGIRGYWSLLVLQSLMKKIKEIERGHGTRHSFHPCEPPEVFSQLGGGDFTPFLPCHYFDLIGGTSTGALIAIMLSQFRMTVEDCMREYENMGTNIFGHPRMLHAVNVPIITRTRFSTRRLTQAFEQVIRRRLEATEEFTSSVEFQTYTGTCRGIALSMTDGESELLCHIRSYKRPGPVPYSTWSILEAARAATAAPLYFKRFSKSLTPRQLQTLARVPTSQTLSSFVQSAEQQQQPKPEGTRFHLIDAGFGIENNPCEKILHEMRTMQFRSKPILVSIGTARPGHPDEEGRRRTLFSTVKRAFRTLGDPENWHAHLQGRAEQGDFMYFRFNARGTLNMEMHEWIPKKSGRKTIDKMRAAFRDWADTEEAQDQLRDCAEQLVKVRRARSNKDRDEAKWARYAVGRYYICEDNGCYCHNVKFPDRSKFEGHLAHHAGGEQRIEDVVQRAEREWEYRSASS